MPCYSYPVGLVYQIKSLVLTYHINNLTGWETKLFWHSPELGSLLYSLYKIPLAQACIPLARPIFTRIGERVSASFPACLNWH